MAQYDFTRDGQAESRAFDARAQHAMKAFQHRFAFGFGYARPIIFDTEGQRARVTGHPHSDMPAGLGVVDGIVDQIAEHFAQQKIVSGDWWQGVAAFEAQIDIFGQCARNTFGSHFTRQYGNIDLLQRLRIVGGRLRARQR